MKRRPNPIGIRFTTCILGKDCNITQRNKTNSFVRPHQSQGRDDSQYRCPFSTQPQTSRQHFLFFNTPSTHLGPKAEYKWPSECTSAPACQGTRRSTLHKSCRTNQLGQHTCERSRLSKTCSWSTCESRTSWSSTKSLLAGKRRQWCWMYNWKMKSWS